MNEKYHWLNDYNKIVKIYENESDRGVALLAASFFEHVFGEKLKSFFVTDKSVEPLFKGYGLLASFSGKIDVSYALGLLTSDMKSDLNLIRKIRNYFAHHPEYTNFADSPVKDFCANLTTAKGIPTQDEGLFRKDNPRDQYLFAVILSLVYFDRFIQAEPRRSIPPKPLPR